MLAITNNIPNISKWLRENVGIGSSGLGIGGSGAGTAGLGSGRIGPMLGTARTLAGNASIGTAFGCLVTTQRIEFKSLMFKEVK